MNNWVLSYRFPNKKAANQAYDRAEEVVLNNVRGQIPISMHHVGFVEDDDPDGDESHFLLIIGDEVLPPQLRERFNEVCSDGESRLIPSDVAQNYVDVHNQMRQDTSRHYRPRTSR
jgi:hypothetical protein